MSDDLHLNLPRGATPTQEKFTEIVEKVCEALGPQCSGNPVDACAYGIGATVAQLMAYDTANILHMCGLIASAALHEQKAMLDLSQTATKQ